MNDLDRWVFQHLGVVRTQLYTEWKYFKVHNEEVRAFFSFVLLSPYNLLGLGRFDFVGRIFADELESVYEAELSTPIKQLQFTEAGGLGLKDKSFGIAIHKRDYHLQGRLGAQTFDLHFEPLAEGFHHFSEKLDPLGITSLDWKILQPRAKVSGTLVHTDLSGQTREFSLAEAEGYVDSDWGLWNPFTLEWDWLSISQDDWTLIVGEIRNKRFGQIYLVSPTAVVVFNKSQDDYSVSYGDDGGQRHARFVAQKAGTEFVLELEVEREQLVSFEMVLASIPLKNFDIWQQQCKVSLRLKRPGQAEQVLETTALREFTVDERSGVRSQMRQFISNTKKTRLK